MPRPARAFTAESFALEGRLLLAVAPASTPTNPPTVQFVGVTDSSAVFNIPVQVVTQRAGKATVTLERSDAAGSLRVHVTTGASSPYVGAVDRTVTFADGQKLATLIVPILSGAPNPGDVDVNLFVKPIDQASTGLGMLDLRIVASDPKLPPKVVSIVASDHGILVSFNKPMNPVGASNVKNYPVYSAIVVPSGILGGLFGGSKLSVNPVPLRSAEYDPATQSVALIPKQRNLHLTIGWEVSQLKRLRTSARPGHPSNGAQGLTDLQGNPVNGDTTPGMVGIRLFDRGIPW